MEQLFKKKKSTRVNWQHVEQTHLKEKHVQLVKKMGKNYGGKNEIKKYGQNY